jgi:type IV pilus assembly protein PilB
MKRKKLGEVLRERGHISPEDLATAIKDQQGKVTHLGELMLDRGLVAKQDLGEALAEVTRVPYVDCDLVEVDPEVLKLIPLAMARRACVFALGLEGQRLTVVLAEPQNLNLLDELRFTTSKQIIARFAFRTEIQTAIDRLYEVPPAETDLTESIIAAAVVTQEESDSAMEFISTSSQQRNQEALRDIKAELNAKNSPAVTVVAKIIGAAVTKGASDIHIEPQTNDTIVRLRVDGLLRDLQRIPRSLQFAVVSRIKILADMDIAERRNSQDGRFLVKTAGRKIDLRVSTLPTQHGEKVVMRLLESEAPLQDFSNLGFAPEISDGLKKMLSQPQGMILVTGPTGAGKSTTLYSSLNYVMKPSVNIITVEDPVEYAVPGLNQVQVNVKAGLTFPTCLRSILRQDPNVIMVGEIRDKETAEIALKAAQTGHLVLSTLHTNDAIAAVTRVLDLGIPAFQIATAVTGIIAQRLVRRLCTCKKVIAATPEYTEKLIETGSELLPFETVAVGCDLCDHVGYRGRIGIYELLVFDEPIRNAVRNGGRNDEIRMLARASGMRMMQDYALDKLAAGLTTLQEIMRVIPFEKVEVNSCTSCSRDLVSAFSFCPYCGKKRKPVQTAAETSNRSTVLVNEGD